MAVQHLKEHWPEYLIEAWALGTFMVSACAFGVLIFHPSSPVSQAVPDMLMKRVLMGIAMGATAIALIYSPWGKQSGAHMNPSVTLTFFRLGKVKPWDAIFYVVAQFIGGVAGVVLATLVFGGKLGDLRYVMTMPGSEGPWVAFLAEFVISFLMMMMILHVTSKANLEKLTGIFAGILVATYITIEDPFSGMSMNPARTFGSAFMAQMWSELWIYFLAPPLGMLSAAQLYVTLKGRKRLGCAKLHHQNTKRCIHCGSPGGKDAKGCGTHACSSHACSTHTCNTNP